MNKTEVNVIVNFRSKYQFSREEAPNIQLRTWNC